MEEPSDSSRGFDLFNHFREEDSFLQYLVANANSYSPVELGIIVTSGGFVISGVLTSGALYFEHFASAFTGATAERLSGVQLAIKNEIEGVGTPYREHANGGEAISDPRYFHMREAIVVGADGSATIGPVWWHGRIDFVSGLVLGIIQPATAADS